MQQPTPFKSYRGSDDLDACQATISQILLLPDRHPFLISTAIQLGLDASTKSIRDPEDLMDRVWSLFEQIHQALCSWVTASALDPTEPSSPISFEFMDIDDEEDRTATIHSIIQIHPQTVNQFQDLMDLEFKPVIDHLPGVPVVSISARPIIREE